MNTVHVVGAGLAGLSAALTLSERQGSSVVLYDAGPVAGGRCRSFYERTLGIDIDNGNHLLLSGNRAAWAYIAAIGTTEGFDGPDGARFPFIDVKTGERWTVRPNNGRIPWWVLLSGRRIPGTKPSDYLELRNFLRLVDDTPVAEAMRRGRLYQRLVEPLAIAALNTRPQVGLARLLGAVMRETLLRGGRACIPRFPKAGLSSALVDPAVALLRRRDASVQFGRRIAALTIEDGRVTALHTPADTIALGPGDSVILAVPPWVAADLLPGLVAPDAFEAILNIHFAFRPPAEGPLREAGFLGMVESSAEWLFAKRDHLSVTISAANAWVDQSPEAIASTAWTDVRAALGIDGAMPAFRVIKERRATFAATAAQEARRPGARVGLTNLALAGDWTDTGLPATIEGAIRSGRTAADILLAG